MTRNGIKAFLLIICVMDALMIGVLMGATVHPLAGLATGGALLLAPVALVPLVMLLLGSISGWGKIAARFPAQPKGAKPVPTLTSIALRWSGLRYNNCIEWCADDEHLHLSMAMPFALAHPDLSIPWGEAEIRELKRDWYRIDAGGFALFVPGAMVKKELALRSAIDDSPPSLTAVQ